MIQAALLTLTIKFSDDCFDEGVLRRYMPFLDRHGCRMESESVVRRCVPYAVSGIKLLVNKHSLHLGSQKYYDRMTNT